LIILISFLKSPNFKEISTRNLTQRNYLKKVENQQLQVPKTNPNRMRFLNYEPVMSSERGYMCRAQAHRIMNASHVDEATRANLVKLFNNQP
jgi:hypothetical protein